MFTEILRVKPVLDQAAAKNMERTLSKRFGNVAKKFGGGLKEVMKGTLLFAALGFLTQILNPLKEMEERIKALMGQGTDLKEAADQLGTSAGKLQALRSIATNIGLTPDKLQTMMDTFANAVDRAGVEKARGEELTGTSKIVQRFIGEKDMAKAFVDFTQALKAADPKARETIERELFGGRQKGANQRFIDADFAREFARLGGPGIGQTDRATNKLAKLDELARRKQTQREATGFVEGANTATPKMINDLAKSAEREQEKQLAQMKSWDDLAKAKEGIDQLSAIAQQGLHALAETAGYAGTFAKWVAGGGPDKMFNKYWEKMKSWRPWK